MILKPLKTETNDIIYHKKRVIRFICWVWIKANEPISQQHCQPSKTGRNREVFESRLADSLGIRFRNKIFPTKRHSLGNA